MPNKRKCKYCKNYTSDFIKTNAGVFCCFDHAIEWGKEKAARDKIKASEKVRKEKKREFKANDIKTRKEAAKTACHAYIRYRDRNDSCICCNEPLGDLYHAGHYLPSGQNSNVRFNENNIHGQRVDCNYFKGGDSGLYEQNLIKKIGVFEYYCIKLNKGGVNKRTAQDYRDIELHYKAKLKELTTKD